METVMLGKTGIGISRMGLGCMGMSEFYGPADRTQALKTVDRALELGVNFPDTAHGYGRGANEELVGGAIRGRRRDASLRSA
jgi:aryl-alcohol dehydrogenase-like predicted oxidoreductase